MVKEFSKVRLKTGDKVPLSLTEIKISRKRFKQIEELERTSMSAKHGDTQLAVPDRIRKKAIKRAKRFERKETKKLKLVEKRAKLTKKKAIPRRPVKARFKKRKSGK